MLKYAFSISRTSFLYLNRFTLLFAPVWTYYKFVVISYTHTHTYQEEHGRLLGGSGVWALFDKLNQSFKNIYTWWGEKWRVSGLRTFGPGNSMSKMRKAWNNMNFFFFFFHLWAVGCFWVVGVAESGISPGGESRDPRAWAGHLATLLRFFPEMMENYEWH